MFESLVSATDNALGAMLAIASLALVVVVQAADIGTLPRAAGRLRILAWPFAACMCALFALRVVVLA